MNHCGTTVMPDAGQGQQLPPEEEFCMSRFDSKDDLDQARMQRIHELMAQVGTLETQLAQAKSSAQYAWSNTKSIEAARQDEMRRRDKAEAQLGDLIGTQAYAALQIAKEWDALEQDDPIEAVSLSEMLINAKLFHTRDEGNIRKDGYFNHRALCYTFEDGSRLVKLVLYKEIVETSDWAIVPKAKG